MDTYWTAALKFARKRDPDGRFSIAPESAAYGISYDASWSLLPAQMKGVVQLILHKGQVTGLPTAAMAQFAGRSQVTFANEVFVILEKTSLPRKDRGHVAPFFEALDVARLPDGRGSTGSERMAGTYVGDHTLLTETWRRDFIYLDADDAGLTPQILRSGEWEIAIERLFLDRLKPGMHVVDVGANCGYFTLSACRSLGPGGTVLAVEANPKMARRVVQSIFANSYQDRARVMGVAASDSEGDVELTIPSEGSGFGSLLGGTRAGERVSVKSYRLDQIVDAKPIDVLKIDVEGVESLVWKGAQEAIGRSPHLTVFMEFMPTQIAQLRDPGDFLDEIKSLGFQIEEIAPDGRLLPDDRSRLLTQTWGELLLTRGSGAGAS